MQDHEAQRSRGPARALGEGGDLLGTAVGARPELAATQDEPWASHCWTGFTEIEYPTGVVALVVPPTTSWVGEVVLVPSLTATGWAPIASLGR